jgi:hypothetical protein
MRPRSFLLNKVYLIPTELIGIFLPKQNGLPDLAAGSIIATPLPPAVQNKYVPLAAAL